MKPAKPKPKPKKPKKYVNPPPVKVMSSQEYARMLKGDFIPEGW